MEKVRETTQKLFCGETIVNKRDLWFLGGLMFLAGVIYGLILAPWTKGVSMGCCNGNNENHYHNSDLEDEEAQK